ncbi:MAG: NAD+ synthase [Athalassotoga sp.]|uniref:NAD+ synthase n=1 Tax=Athalassotoga sp. TaxID=2022597 RepID=UPI003D08B067
MKALRFAIAQKNFVVGGIDENLEKIKSSIEEARKYNPDFIIFPELAITGYPPEDLLFRMAFLQKNIDGLNEIANFSKGKDEIIIVGFVDLKDDIYNAAAIIQNGKLIGIYHKILLPNYGVFDEKRYFSSGIKPMIVEVDNVKVGISICEDIWVPDGPIVDEVDSGAMVLVNISSSPYNIMKGSAREKMIQTRASDLHTAIVYANVVGGQDELVFDGHSFVVDENGNLIARAKDFEEEILIADVDIPNIVNMNLHDPRRRERIKKIGDVDAIRATLKESPKEKIEKRISPSICLEEEIFKALVLGTRDYITKNGFKKVLIGLSGGIDSSLVAVIASEAIGSENVIGVMMPSMYSSASSIEDARALALNLGIKTFQIGITDVYNSYIKALEKIFEGTQPNITEENLQARIRGNYLMAISNKFGYLVLTTGNKSEMSTGYATLYGDMAGGFDPIKDLYKTMVYRVCKWFNESRKKEIIPNNVFVKPPSAELKPNQVDQDTLPPYELLDSILELYVEKDFSFEEITEMGFDPEMVKKTIKLVDTSEYKRRQSPPGVKITFRAFGRDRRLPITNHFRG